MIGKLKLAAQFFSILPVSQNVFIVKKWISMSFISKLFFFSVSWDVHSGNRVAVSSNYKWLTMFSLFSITAHTSFFFFLRYYLVNVIGFVHWCFLEDSSIWGPGP